MSQAKKCTYCLSNLQPPPSHSNVSIPQIFLLFLSFIVRSRSGKPECSHLHFWNAQLLLFRYQTKLNNLTHRLESAAQFVRAESVLQHTQCTQKSIAQNIEKSTIVSISRIFYQVLNWPFKRTECCNQNVTKCNDFLVVGFPYSLISNTFFCKKAPIVQEVSLKG